MRWDEIETQKFVKIYLSHNLLWNPENEEYNMKFRRQQTYKQIAAQFRAVSNISLNDREVRKKIKNLRATYSQELVKIKQRSTPSHPFRPTIKWFADFHRCLKNLQGKKLKEESFGEDQLIEDSQKVWVPDDDGTAFNGNHDPNKDPFTLPPDENYILLKTELDDTKTSEGIEIHTPIKSRKRKYKRTPSIVPSDQTFVSSDSTSGEDEFDIYGKYIASQLRRMGLERALRVQLQIQSIVSEARIDNLTENQ